MEKLKMNLQMFNEVIGLLSKGTVLEYQSGSAWMEVAAVRSIPEMGGGVETVDVTHLQSEQMTNIPGLKSAENLTFAIVYQGENFNDLYALEVSGAQINWRVTYPSGLQAVFTGQAVVSMGAAETNSALESTLTVIVSKAPIFVTN